MKKIIFGLIGLLFLGGVGYYLTVDSNRVVKTITLQKEFHNKIENLKLRGFEIENHKIDIDTEEFIISVKNSKRVINFLKRENIKIDEKKVENLNGLKLFVKVKYEYKFINLDITPISLPNSYKESIEDEMEKKVLAKIEKLMKEKKFLVNLQIDYQMKEIKGKVKDINEKIALDGTIFILKDFKFLTLLQNNHITNIQTKVEDFHLFSPNEANVTLKNYRSKITPTKIKYNQTYALDYFNNGEKKPLILEDFFMSSISTLKDKNSSEIIHIQSKKMQTHILDEKVVFYDLDLKTKVENLNIENIDKIKKEPKATDEVVKELLSNDIHFEITNLNVAKVKIFNKEADGFDIFGGVDINHTIDLSKLQTDFMKEKDKLDLKLKIIVSKSLYRVLSKKRKIKLATFIIKPKKEKGKRVYTLELKKGKIKINNISISKPLDLFL